MSEEPLVRVRDLSVSFGERVAVREVSLDLWPGQVVAIVGESGSGKSVTARTLLGLAGERARVRAARLSFDGQDLRTASERRWRGLRGRQIGLVSQDALGSLDPLRRVGTEVAEPLREHRVVERSAIKGEVRALLTAVGIPDPDVRARQYPHQLSGGLRQRALLASALAGRPRLLIADEPTTALDVTVQRQVLALLRQRAATGTALLLISHDLAVVAEIADHIHVMRDGRFVEDGSPVRVLTAPRHDYTRALVAAIPTATSRRRAPAGVSGLVNGAGGVGARADGRTGLGGPVDDPAGTDRPDPDPDPDPGPVLVRLRDVGKRFAAPGGRTIVAAENVSLTIRAGETLGVVGESGSGKSTLGRLILGLLAPDTGTVEFAGRSWHSRSGADRRAARRRIQMIYQDPLASFDPRYTVRQVLAEALRAAGMPTGGAGGLLTMVGLAAPDLDRSPMELSGGQRQRLAIARALAVRPEVIVCDEPVSALDVSIQAQVLEVLADVQRRLGVAYFFISHDLAVVHQIADRVLVMRGGKVVESGDAVRVFTAPRHPYTRELLAAVPGRIAAGSHA